MRKFFPISENIYYQESAESIPKKIASSSDEQTIMNGIPDWLYEEEILSKESAIWFSPGGTRLLYASFNDSGVDQTVYPLYGNYDDNLNTSPEMMSVRYPKVCSNFFQLPSHCQISLSCFCIKRKEIFLI